MCATVQALAQARLMRVLKQQAVPRHTVKTDRGVSRPMQTSERAAMTATTIRKTTYAMVRDSVQALPTNARLLRSAHLDTTRMAMAAPRTMQRPRQAVMMEIRPLSRMSAMALESVPEIHTVVRKPMPVPLATPKMALDVLPSTQTRVLVAMMAMPPQTTMYATAKANVRAHPTVAQLPPAARLATSKMEPDANRLMHLLEQGATTVTTRQRTTPATDPVPALALPTRALQAQRVRQSIFKMAVVASHNMPLRESDATIRTSPRKTTCAMAAADAPALLIVVRHRLPAPQATVKMAQVVLPIMHRTVPDVTTATPRPRTTNAMEKERAPAHPTVARSQQHVHPATVRMGVDVSLTTLHQELDATMAITPPTKMCATGLEHALALLTAVLPRRRAHRATPRTVRVV